MECQAAVPGCEEGSKLTLMVLSDAAEPLLLEREPDDTSDPREVRHWIRVYSSLLELSTSLPQGESSDPVNRRLLTWKRRLDFWQDRARRVSNPSTRVGR